MGHSATLRWSQRWPSHTLPSSMWTWQVGAARGCCVLHAGRRPCCGQQAPATQAGGRAVDSRPLLLSSDWAWSVPGALSCGGGAVAPALSSKPACRASTQPTPSTHATPGARPSPPAVVEVGLGGVRDATNVFSPQSLAAAVITAVGVDHAAALGGAIEQIAAAKAGIMKQGRPVVLARQPEATTQQVLLGRGGCMAWCVGGGGESLVASAWPGSVVRVARLPIV